MPRSVVVLVALLAACRFDASGILPASDRERLDRSPTDRESADEHAPVDRAPVDQPADHARVDRATPDRARADRAPVDRARPDSPACPAPQTWCGKCVNTGTDNNNCGNCGKTCSPPQHCSAGSCVTPPACASGVEAQVFSGGMRGCKGKVTFPNRATLCTAGFHVCSAVEWVNKHGSVAPTHIYWTDDFLYADSGGSGMCTVRPTPSTWCGGPGWPPMRVCSGKTDPEGNTCNWINCGYLANTPNQYFGGCQNNMTAGALCCAP
jgi:hypothetical protein